jgi:membrane-associated protease RseP (regulator of RpoE activity)
MRMKRVMLVLVAALALTVSAVGAVYAAPRGQEAAPDAARDAAGRAGHVARPSAGMVLLPLTDGIKKVLGLPQELTGAAVAGALPGSPAEEAGIVRGDVVVAVDGADVDGPRAVAAAIGEHEVGESVVLTIVRDGERQQVSLVLGEEPERAKPEWLRNLHQLLRSYPNIGEATITLVDDEGNPTLYHAVVGTVATVSGDVLTVTTKTGASVSYTVGEDVVVVKGGYKVALGRLEAGDPVAVLEVDGELKAVVAGKIADPAPRPHVRPTDAPVNPRRGIVERFRENTKQIREELRGGQDAAERVERLREQIRKLQERLSQVNEQGDAA